GYRLEGERWQRLQQLPYVLDPQEETSSNGVPSSVLETHVATVDDEPGDVVVAVGPAFAAALRMTINGLPHADVLRAITEGVREGGGRPRLVTGARRHERGRLRH